MLSPTKGVLAIFFASMGILNCVNTSDYNELLDLGASCYPRDSCQCTNCPTCRTEGKTCECDATCYRRGTCCIDSPYVDHRQSKRNEVCSKRIHALSSYYYFREGGTSFFQVAQCDTSWEGSVQTKQLCEIEHPIDGTDLMVAIPVTNLYSGITYKNYFCALCNNDIEGSVLWDFDVMEDDPPYRLITNRFTIQPTDETYDALNDGTEDSNSCSGTSPLALVYKEGNGYGYWDHGCNSSRFVQISVHFTIPSQIQHLVKGCRSELISSCPPNWTDIRVKVLCESYLGIISGPKSALEYQQVYFRNAHCALCNNVTYLGDYSCKPFAMTPVLTPAYPVSTTLLLGHLLADEKCSGKNEKFVESLGGCRAIICPNPKHKVENGKCTL